MATLDKQIGRIFEGPGGGREARTLAEALLGNCPITSGKVTLVAGTATVSIPSVTSSSIVLLTPNSNPGASHDLYATVTAGTGITISDVAGSSTATVAYIVI